MFGVTSSTVYPAIQEWEKSSILLCDALSRYLELSVSLGKRSLVDGIPPMYLAGQIDSALGVLHTILGRQFSRAHSVLAQTRNQLLSPVQRLPAEILSDIFIHSVFDPLGPSQCGDPASMKRGVANIYRSLYSLIRVCTTWRTVMLNTHSLWSIVPLFHLPTAPMDRHRGMDYMARQPNGAWLKLVTDLGYDSENLSVLSTQASRLHTINIAAPTFNSIRGILEIINNKPGPEQSMVSRLSIYRKFVDKFGGPSEEEDFFQSAAQQEPFNQLFENLSVIQLRGGTLHWGAIGFSQRLTTFCLQEVNLGYDSMIPQLFKALSSATQLRELSLIKIRTMIDSSPLQGLLARSKIWLPSLRSLFIQDLYFNTLRIVLLSIQSRSHRLSLVFTRQSLQLKNPGRSESRDLDTRQTCKPFRNTPVHALLVDTESLASKRHVLSPLDLMKLLEAMPSLETLWFNIWNFDDRYSNFIRRPRDADNLSFPSLVNLYFSIVRLTYPEAFKNMVNSYSGSIQQVALGGASRLITRQEVNWTTSEGEEELATWLSDNVPKFRRIDENFEPPDFRQILWRLW